jgi:hypothetical protein
MDQQMASQLGADLFLPHAPSVFEFRERDEMRFAYLSDRVNVTPVYDIHPTAFRRDTATARGNGKGSHPR